MKMTPANLVVGILLIFAAILFVVVLLPYFTYVERGSEIYRERSGSEAAGRKLYMANPSAPLTGTWVRKESRRPGTMLLTGLYCLDPQEQGLTSPRKEENTRMIGTPPTSSIPGPRDLVPSCRPLLISAETGFQP
jgi:hypothetical protein